MRRNSFGQKPKSGVRRVRFDSKKRLMKRVVFRKTEFVQNRHENEENKQCTMQD